MDKRVANVDLVWPARPNFSLPLIKFKVHGYSGPGWLGDAMAYPFLFSNYFYQLVLVETFHFPCT